MNLSTPGHKMLSPAAPQESPTKSFHCSHCPLTFKSKVFLFEHLNNVHDVSVGTALRDAGLSGTNKDNNSDSSISAFECQDILKTHEKCDKKIEDQKMKGSLVISENTATTISVIAATAHRKAARSKEISSEVMSTSKTKCIENTSRDLKTYKRPLQTITKYFKAAPGSNGNPPFKSPDNQVPLDCNTGTLILQESPPISSPNSSGVFKVTAKPMIDLSKMSQVRARILIDDLTPVTPDGQIKQRIPNNAGKRTSKESLKSPLNKKMKIDEEEAKANVQKSEFSFEVSEDEEEKRINLVNREVESPKVYFCKHCDYNDVDIKSVSTHYENDHPFIRYTSDYIRDPSDQSATFRCLECPIEFLKVIDLKKHYTESHPEAPDVFTIPLGELHLVFKCFVCPSTSHTLKALRRHYKEMHPTHKVRNSLMYCRYSVARCQEATYQLNTCEKTTSSEGIATENGPLPCEEVKKSPSFQHSTSKGAGVTLFQCNNCDFSHKSVVVMHVHYQKSHPEEEVTIDKIKQLTCVTSQTTARKTSESPNSVSIVEKSTPQKVSDFPKTKNKAKTQETSKTHSESSKTKKLESSDDRTPAKCDGKMSSQMGSLSPTSPNTVFYCQLCSYSSINIRSVVSHHNAKHSMHEQISIQEILKYTAEVQKKKCQSEAEVSGSAREQHAYTNAKDLFFCPKCNFGNPTVKGVMGHQAKIHPELKQSNVRVIEHTALIHEEIEKSKSQAKGSSFSSDLPFPLLNEGDECRFFCYLCNYRQRTVHHVMRHFLKIHRGIRAKEDQICQYTSKVLENKLHLKATSNLEVHQASVGKIGKKLKKTKNLDKSSTVSAFSSKKASQTQKVFECQRCTFKSQNVRLLKRHIRKFHRSHSSVSNVLNVSSKQGKLQSGYRCGLCAFTHTKATTLYNHYQEKHPEHKQSLKFIMTRLYVGPETSVPKKKKAQIKRPDVISGFDGTNERLQPQRSGQNETKTYRCRACSFKGHSVSSITHHYRAVHPWSVKEDGSVLDLIHVIPVNRKKPSTNKHLEDLSELPESFDTYQAPIEFENFPDSSDEATASVMLKCPHCPLLFDTRHGLNTHCGMKHLHYASEQQVKGQTSVHAFKCPHCTYVNSNHHGVITHCHMRHPSLESGAESLHVDDAHLHDWDGCMKRTSPGGKLRFSGYICKTCPQIHTTAEKLYKHCKEDHNQTEPAVSKTEQSEADDTLRSVSKGSLFHKKNYAVVRCRHCDYQCTTKIALGRHILANHKNAPVSQCAYKCVICSKTYFRKKSLGNHYSEKHGKYAFFKYYVPLYENGSKKPAPTSPDFPSSQVAENSPEAFQPSTATGRTPKMIFKCPSCPYVNTSSHGTLTHCQMKHPDVMVRAETLETDEIPLADMAACTLGKGSNERGYMCKICSQIHASSKKLKIHIERLHDQASVHSTEIETENQSLSTDSNCQGTELEVDKDSAFDQKSATERADHEIVYRCPQCPYASLTQRYLASHYSQKHGKKASRKHYANVYQKPFKKSQPPSSVHHYKCDICSYNGMQRRYLWRHYKVHHRLDSITTCRRLLKYNKVKNNTSKLPESESEDSSQIKCKKCPNLFFDSFEVLSLHYSTLHSSDCKMDFTVIYPPSKSTSGVYRCCHCKKQSNGLKKLRLHMDQHREENKNQKNTAKKVAERTKGFDAFTRTPEVKSTELQDEEPTLQSVEEPAQMNITQVETVISPTSPLSSPSKPADLELLKTLDDDPESALNRKINKHVVFKPGTLRPFRCRICYYRTTSIPLWRIHFMKHHQDLLMDPAETDNHDEENTQAPEKDSPSSKPADVHQSDPESREDKHTCKQCARTFKSLRGLRCHENSHAAVAAIKKLDNLSTSALKHNINKYVVFKPGTMKAFLCSICHYRTDVMALWKRHFMKNHRDVLINPAETDNHDKMNTQLDERRSPNSSEELYYLSEPDEEPEITEKSMYLEPPDVQRQLNHYSLMAEAGSSSKANVQQSKLPENSLLHCEFCNFTSEHFSSIRRHLQNRHGRKIHKCKDCNFFSGCRKTLDIHIEAGHSTYQSEPTHEKDLRCPFCLYQTKNKNNMIDHIILHREERVVPIEVRRPQLSRYLRGIVFRCHKCTFTSASAENLNLHMAKHDEIKPYKCRLCYFDCTELCDLEAHLCDKHQVVRNHALVGQISLDQQEARVGRTPEEEEEEPLSNLEYHNKSEDIEPEEFVTDCNEVQHENVKLQTEEGSRKDNEEESLTSSSADTPDPEKHGQDPQKRAQNEKFLTDTLKRREPDTERENTADVHFDDNIEPEKDKQTDENQRKPSNRRLLLLQQREEATGAHKLKVKVLQDRMLNLEAGVENDILRHILVLDEEGSFSRTHRKAVRSVITENIENEVVDKVLNQVILRDEQCSVISAKPKHLPEIKAETPDVAKKNLILENNIDPQECLTLTPHRIKNNKQVDEESVGTSLINCKEEHVQNQTSCEELADPYGAMPVLENERLKDETFTCRKEEEDDRFEDRGDEGTGSFKEHEEGNGIKEADDPLVIKGAVSAVNGAAEVQDSPMKLFPCELCGRNLMNSSELERHVIRHRI